MARRIGLLTLPLHINYGGILQAVALYHTLRSESKRDVVFIERGSSKQAWQLHWFIIQTLSFMPGVSLVDKLLTTFRKKRSPIGDGRLSKIFGKIEQKIGNAAYLKRARGHRRFIEENIPLRSGPLNSSEEIYSKVKENNIDTLVVGSDQVWRLDYAPGEQSKEDFFFAFATDPNITKISYAASFGEDSWTYPLYTERVKTLLADFDAISVREKSGVDICQQVFGISSAHHVLDPTLLLDVAFYEGLAAPSRKRGDKTMLTYILDEGADRQAIYEEIRTTLGSEYSTESLTLDKGLGTLDVPSWLRAFLDADFVVTDSFHGMVFSIIFRKNFVAIANRERGADRFRSLLKLLNLEERLIFEASPQKLHALAEERVDFDNVHETLAALRAESLDFLRNALK